MSSAVNKSQKKFMPKVSSRGPGGRAPAQRLSTLRASFSVPPASPSPAPSVASLNQSKAHQSAPTRSQLLGLDPTELAKVSESAVDESIPEAKRVKRNESPSHSDISVPMGSLQSPYQNSNESLIQASNNEGEHAQAINQSYIPASELPSVSSGKPVSTSQPLASASLSSSAPSLINMPSATASSISAKSRSRAVAKPGTVPSSSKAPITTLIASEPVGTARKPAVSAVVPTAVASINKDMNKPPEPKPNAPDGYEYIWPEDLPKRRAEERRRKMAVEKELITIMRELYMAKEKERILSEHIGMDDDVAQGMAEQAAELATYNQLKQQVGVEAKQKRDSSHINDPEQIDENSKTLSDVNKFTMAALCKDIPVGDRNTSYDDYESARVNRRRDTVRVFRAKMWSRRMYQPKESERAALREAYQKYQNERKERNGKIKTEQEQKFTEIDDASETVGSSGGHPQASIEIQANGSISLVGTQFDRHKNNRTQREGGTSGPKTEVDPTEQVINSYSYSTRERPDRWTPEETTKFYEAVSALGTDFNLIAHLFPMRSRNQIKTKFKYEEKRNPAKLQIYLVSRRKFNSESYSKVSNVAIQEVDSIENELEKVRKEHAEQLKMEEEARLIAKQEDQKKPQPSDSRQKASAGPKRERP